MDHPNIDPSSIVIDDEEPAIGTKYLNEAKMFGKTLGWENGKLLYRYAPKYKYDTENKKDGYIFSVTVYDTSTGDFINDWDKVEEVEFDEKNPLEGAEKAIEYIRREIE